MPQAARPPRPPTSRRSLTGWVVGFGCSILADQVFFLSLAWAAVQLGVPGLVGLVLAAGSLPRLLVLLTGGALADGVSPKRIIIGTDSGRSLLMVLTAGVLLSGHVTAWVLVAVALAVGLLDGLFLPAVAALPVRVAPPHLMGRVSALRTVTQRVGMLSGGPLAGWLIHAFSPAVAFLGSAALFALSVGSLTLVALRSPSPATPARAADPADLAAVVPGAPRRRGLLARVRADLVDAARLLRSRPLLAAVLLLIAGMNLGFAGPFTAGIPVLADAHGWGASGAGLLIGAFGVGAAASGLGLLLVEQVPHGGLVQLVAVFVMGLAVAAVGIAPVLPVGLVAALVLGLASGLFGTIVYGLLLKLSAAEEVGRVMALLSLTLEATAGLSFLGTGLLASHWGAGTAFLLGGLVIVVTTLGCATRRSIRQLRVEPEPEPAAKPVPVGS